MNRILIKRYIQLASYYVWPVGLLLWTMINGPRRATFSLYGEVALILVGVNLYIKPLALLTRVSILQFVMAYRREIGVTAFWSFLFHSLGMIYVYKFGFVDLFTDTSSFIFFGAVAGICMWLLGLTSNDYAVGLLKANWKRLHRIAYAAFLLALYHYSLVEGEVWRFYLIGGIYIALKIIQFARFKRI